MTGGLESQTSDHTIVIACSAAATVVVLLMFCILCHRKRRRRQRRLQRSLPLPIPGGSSRRPPQHVCEELGERFASVDSV